MLFFSRKEHLHHFSLFPHKRDHLSKKKEKRASQASFPDFFFCLRKQRGIFFLFPGNTLEVLSVPATLNGIEQKFQGVWEMCVGAALNSVPKNNSESRLNFKQGVISLLYFFLTASISGLGNEGE